MILGFNPRFVDKILDSTKIHTIRIDAHNRWKAGRSIQFATGVRTKKYKQFKEGVCVSVQHIKIQWRNTEIRVTIDGSDEIMIPSKFLEFVKNDGFDTAHDFYTWFKKDFEGKIIHWTDKRY